MSQSNVFLSKNTTTPYKSNQKGRFRKMISSPGLKFSVIIPFILIAILSSTLLGFYLATGELSLKVLIFSMISFSIVIGPVLIITRQAARRINQIIEAADQVAQGDLSIRIDDTHEDEIGQLVRAFNQMVANLDNLQRSRDLLSRTMSPTVRHSLIEKGLDFRGITQVVSILFIDIRSFTQITERHNTEQLVFFLNDYYTTIANQVHIGGGIIGKYGGDSIMAFFGAPEPEPAAKSSLSALLTALALQEAIEELSDRWSVLGLPPIRVGMGLSIGSVVAGPIGSEEQFEYTIIGNSVNLAARLQALTRTVSGYDIMISAEVYEALDHRIKAQMKMIDAETYNALDEKQKASRTVHMVDFGEVSIRGKKGPVQVYGIPNLDAEVPTHHTLVGDKIYAQ